MKLWLLVGMVKLYNKVVFSFVCLVVFILMV